MIRLEGPTRMDTNGHVSIKGEALGGFEVQIKVLWYPPIHIVIGPGRGIWDRQNENIIEQSNTPTSFGTTDHFFGKKNTEMTALAKSIDLKGGWTDFIQTNR